MQVGIPDSGLAAELQLIDLAEEASKGQRFLNWLIDNLLMRFGLNFASALAVGALLGWLAPEYILSIANGESSFGLLVISYCIVIVNYLVYYTFCEKVFHGRTIGKLITGTRALRLDEQPLTLRDAFMRSLCRLIPFEPFSGFGYSPWHDKFTRTKVIRTR